jgi:ATP synthase protein I
LLKIIATVAIFISAVLLYADLKWLPMLLTYVLALKCYLLVWVVRK